MSDGMSIVRMIISVQRRSCRAMHGAALSWPALARQAAVRRTHLEGTAHKTLNDAREDLVDDIDVTAKAIHHPADWGAVRTQPEQQSHPS
jgi:hypothetical protein